MSRLISFDIDGTMVFGQPPGHVTLEMVRKAKELGYVIGSASDRTIGNQKELWKAFNIEVDFVTLKHHLPDIKEKFGVGHYMHVGDTDMDRHFAKVAGFDFLLITEVPRDGSHDWLLTTPKPQPVRSNGPLFMPGSAATPIVMVDRPCLFFVGFEIIAADEVMPEYLPTAWKWVFERQYEMKHRYGETFAELTLPCVKGVNRKLIGAEVTKVESVPMGMTAVGVPAHKYLFRRVPGSRVGVPGSFDAMYNWARDQGHLTDGLRLDVGYVPGFEETYHDLLVRVYQEDPELKRGAD